MSAHIDRPLEDTRDTVDEILRRKYVSQWIRCPKGHLNSPNAEICWKCGRTIERAISEERKKERVYESVSS